MLACLSAVLLILSFPGFNLWLLAWVAFIPLFFAIEGQGPLKAFLLSYLTGVLFFFGTIWWLVHVTLPGMIFAVLYLALYFGLFGLLLRYPIPHTLYPLLFFAPSAWVGLEWIRSAGIFGFGWVLLGHSQSFNLPIIQIADITGVYGVSFLIIMVNAALYMVAKDLARREYRFEPLMIAALVILLTLRYGYIRLNNVFTGQPLKVAIVQGNIPQDRKWDSNFREDILGTYESLTVEAAKEKPDLIVWPETSVPGFLESERDLLERVRGLASNIGTPLLVGTVREEGGGYYNSAVLFSEEGRPVERYDKIHLVPFGEYIPFKKIFSFVEKFAPVPIGDCTAGRDYRVFDFFIERGDVGNGSGWKMLKKVRFSALICFEDIFPSLSREFIKSGAGFLVNITNDAWYKETAAPFQHAQSSVFRAVEFRTNVIRAANTGLSCFIDQKGRISDTVESGGNIFVSGFRTREIILSRAGTPYMRYGDIFACLCMTYASLYILARLLKPSA